ncbi:MAG: hypothetical protein CSB47_08150 [Proteobacteria bacterium]|nr:MAG: hypothetical protein CSB47_08150 [Pseudomonadota bacterium]
MIRTSAPGSIMISGEHAVVYGHNAIVAAIEQRVGVTLHSRNDQTLRITSQIAPPLETTPESLEISGPYRFVLAAIECHRHTLSSGFELDIRSEIDPTLGLGSSAAVTVACLGAIKRYCDQPVCDLHDDALAIVRRIQGRGSGADLAASYHGGLLAYRPPLRDDDHAAVRTLPTPPTLSLRYCGYKTPTAEVLDLVAKRMQGNEAAFERLYARMGDSSQAAIAAAQAEDWPVFCQHLTDYQTLMDELGVCDKTLHQIIGDARRHPGTLAAKISGSGLGDCVLAVGSIPDSFVPAPLSKQGLIFHD